MAQTLSDLVVPKKPSGIAPTLRDFGRGYNREAVAGLLGAPVDMATTLANLLMAGGGYLGHKAGLLDQPPDLIPNNRAVGSSDWIYDRLPHQPALSNSPAEQAGRLAGALMSPPAVLKAAPTTIRALFDALQEKAPSVIDKYMDAMGAKQNAIVYHGSPHKFDKFDSSKIGTGEGAQAYGHGLYLADSPQVAKSYVDPLYKGRDSTQIGSFQYDDFLTKSKETLQTTTRDRALFSKALAPAKNLEEAAANIAELKALRPDYNFDKVYALLDLAKRYGVNFPSKGSLYTVDLPDSLIARMLDWDKPLGQQAKNIRDFFEPIVAPRRAIEAQVPSAAERLAWGDLADPRVYDPTGKEALFLFGKGRNEWAASPDAAQMFRQRGIPGIRYLDGGSRGAGAGTSNYVVFPGEEGVLKILKRE